MTALRVVCLASLMWVGFCPPPAVAQEGGGRGGGPWSEGGEALLLEFEALYGSPSHRAAEGLPRLLRDEEEDEAANLTSLLTGVYLPSTKHENVSEACRSDVQSIFNVFENPLLAALLISKGRLWPLQLPDSWGKLPDGILNGNFLPWGMMEECTALDVQEDIASSILYPELNATFRGKYCLISFKRSQFGLRSDSEDDLEWPSTRVGSIMALPGNLTLFKYGTCMPSSCSEDDLRVSLNDILINVDKEVRHIDCQTEDQETIFYAGDIAFIVVLAIFAVLLLGGAVLDLSIDYLDLQHHRKGYLRYLLVFSAYTNLKKIFHINNKENPEVISCLHGMRVLSMAWVVWGHGYMFLIDVNNNILGVKELMDDVMDQTVTNATFSVDTFFFMSGLLVAYGILREFSKVKKINWIMFYVHRFLRLTPPILFTAAAMATIARFALFGPMSASIDRLDIQSCRDNWYIDVFYASNFKRNCLPQCWYTAADTQIYIVLPLVLIPLIYKPKIGIPWLTVVTLISFAIPTFLLGVYEIQASSIMFGRPEFTANREIDTYMTPWCRANSYLVGVWAGWLIFQVRGKKLRMPVWAALLGWAVAITVGMLVIYGVADYNTLYKPKLLTLAVSTIYGGLSRGAWCMALLWVVFACHTGYGGLINSFLGHPSWQPLSRLTYAMFLTTIPVQRIYRGTIYMPLYLNHLNKILETLGYLFIGGLLAVLLSLMTEGPILGLEKLIFQRKGRGIPEIPEPKQDRTIPQQPAQKQQLEMQENEMPKPT